MTLVLTHLSPLGIAMAADSAITHVDARTGERVSDPGANVMKLFPVPHLRAGLSAWGNWSMGNNEDLDSWIRKFIADHSNEQDLSQFASTLATELNFRVVNKGPSRTMGIHVAGFVQTPDGDRPTFWHVHDGPSDMMNEAGTPIDPCRFNCNHDLTPSRLQNDFASGRIWWMRNGDNEPYMVLHEGLIGAIQNLNTKGMSPRWSSLDDIAKFLAFEIETVGQLYARLNVRPRVGGSIYYLTIDAIKGPSEPKKYTAQPSASESASPASAPKAGIGFGLGGAWGGSSGLMGSSARLPPPSGISQLHSFYDGGWHRSAPSSLGATGRPLWAD